MKEKKLFRVIGGADDNLLAKSEKINKRFCYGKWIAIAACFVLIISTIIVVKDKGNNELTADPSLEIIIEGLKYSESSWDTTMNQCPDGFIYGGRIESSSTDSEYLVGCNYYVNTKIPEWVYVFCPIWDGFSNSSFAYVRYVLSDVRNNTLLRYDNKVYAKLWFTKESIDQKSLKNYQLDLEKRFGIQIETLPANFVLVGNADFEALDRIPQSELGINHKDYDGSQVYANPKENEILFISTAWHTSKEGENGETLHNGYNIFVLYNYELIN